MRIITLSGDNFLLWAAVTLMRVLVLLLILAHSAVAHAEVSDFHAGWRFADPDLQIDDILLSADEQWQAVPSDQALNFGFTEQPVWLRLDMSGEAGRKDRVVVVSYPLLDDLQVFWYVDGQFRDSVHTGDLQPFDTRPLNHRYFVFPVPAEPGQITAYLRAETEGALQFPFSVISVQEFLEQDQASLSWQTLFLGIMLALFIYNAFLFANTRQPVYFWYVLTVAATCLVQINFHGISFQWLWPDFPAFNQMATVLLISVNLIGAGMFTRVFLVTPRYSAVSTWLLNAIVAGGVIGLVLSMFASYYLGILLITVFTFLSTVTAWGVAIYIWKQGQVLARYYILAWTPLLIGHLTITGSKMGVLPQDPIYEYAPQVGAALEVLLLSFALAYRIKLERTRRQEAQHRALTLEREASQTLKIKVAERTRELEEANDRLRTLTLTDGLTKVANRRRFDEKLKEEWARGQRHGHPLSLLVMDIDFFKAVNDNYGHLAGDDCLVALATTCDQEILRRGDLLARFGGEEFAVLLPCTSIEGAVCVAERLREAVQRRPVDTGTGDSISVTVSIGTSCLVPAEGLVQEELIRLADEALYAAKAAGRNRVEVAKRVSRTTLL